MVRFVRVLKCVCFNVRIRVCVNKMCVIVRAQRALARRVCVML